jgi:hypothetical protein
MDLATNLATDLATDLTTDITTNNNAGWVSDHLLVYFVREGTAPKMYNYIYKPTAKCGLTERSFQGRLIYHIKLEPNCRIW